MRLIYCLIVILLMSVPSWADQKLTILYSGSSLGEIQPCGCTEIGDLGGILRRATVIELERSANKNILLLDAGDTFKDPTEQGKLKAKTFIDAMNKMDYDAALLGEKDFIYGEEILNQGSFKSWLLSNVENKNLRQEKTIKYFLKKLSDGTKIVVIGLVGPELLSTKGQTMVKIENPLINLKQILSELKSENKPDVIVLLTHMKKEKARELFNFNAIDIIINGHLDERELIVGPEIAGNRLMVHTRERGQYLGKITLTISNHKIQNALNEYIPLNPKIKDSHSVQALYDNYNEGAKKLFLNWLKKKKKAKKSPYISSDGCKMCHRADYDIWKKSGHSHAFKTLEKSGKVFDQECLICHTTGFKREGGFLSEGITPNLKDVQCESCHGAGSEHILAVSRNHLSLSQRTKYYKKATKKGCLKCHTRENSPEFKFSTYWEKIKHFGKNVENTKSQRLMGSKGYLMKPAFNNRWKEE